MFYRNEKSFISCSLLVRGSQCTENNRRIDINRKFPPCIISLNEGEKNDLIYLSYQAQYKIKTQSL